MGDKGVYGVYGIAMSAGWCMWPGGVGFTSLEAEGKLKCRTAWTMLLRLMFATTPHVVLLL